MADPVSLNQNSQCDTFVQTREVIAKTRAEAASTTIDETPIVTNYCSAEDLNRLGFRPHGRWAWHWIGRGMTIILASGPQLPANGPIPPDEVDRSLDSSNIRCSEERLSPFVNTDLTRLTRRSILSLSRLAHNYGQQEYTFSDSDTEIASSDSLITNIRDTYSIRSGDVVTFIKNLLGTNSLVVKDLRNDPQAMSTLERIYHEINKTRLAYNGGNGRRGFFLEPQMRYVDHSAMLTLCTIETILGHFLGRLKPNEQIEPQNNLGEVKMHELHGNACHYTFKQPS